MKPERAYFRPEKVDLRPDRTDFRPRIALEGGGTQDRETGPLPNKKPVRFDLWTERADLRAARPDLSL